MSGIFSTFHVTASALTAQRLRMDVIANNVANIETTNTQNGGPYQRQQVVFSVEEPEINRLNVAAPFKPPSEIGSGVRVKEILIDDSPGHQVYDPDHPDADEEGFVTYPNVDLATEMTNMLSATRSYEANITVFNALKTMALKALDIARG